MKPISKKMLTCSATLYTKQSLDEDRNVTWENPVTLSSIWITTTRGMTQGANGEQSSDSMMLFYDMVNSVATESSTLEGTVVTTRTEPLFEKGAKVSFNGFDYYINSITPVLQAGGIHHYEIGLV